MPAGRPKGSPNRRDKSEHRHLSPEVELVLGVTAEIEWKGTEAAFGRAFHPRLARLLETVACLEAPNPGGDPLFIPNLPGDDGKPSPHVAPSSMRTLDADDLEAVTGALSGNAGELESEARQRLVDLGEIGEPIDIQALQLKRLAEAKDKLDRAEQAARAVDDKEFFTQRTAIGKRLKIGARRYAKVHRACILVKQSTGQSPTIASVTRVLDTADAGPSVVDGNFQIGDKLPDREWTRNQVREAMVSLGWMK